MVKMDVSTGGIRINVTQLPIYEAVEVYVVFEELQNFLMCSLTALAINYW